MTIGKPEYFLLFLFIIPLTGAAVYGYYSGKKSLKKLCGEWRFEKLFNVFIVKYFFTYIFFTLFLCGCIFALADIRWETQLLEDDRDGFELAIAVDISRSMLADDIRPNRFNAMINYINWFINATPGAQFSIIIFKGKAVKILPVTEDLYALSLFLNTASPDLITVPGSNIEEGINTALKAFTIPGKYRAIVLFTDGENKGGNPLAAARAAGAAGIPVITVCMGTEAGQHIPLGPGNYLRNKEGKMVLSKADPGLLTEIAKQSNGKFYKFIDFHAIRNELLSIAKHTGNENIEKGLKLEKKEQHAFFLSLALIFLILSVLIRGIRWKKTA